ncbi:MAG: hypothetical protein ACD_51C00289G0004 [uncultured bacterium]|nr:MAG: hypothetical protein ACD_51C00289G0004 [uncultured bacterium]
MSPGDSNRPAEGDAGADTTPPAPYFDDQPGTTPNGVESLEPPTPDAIPAAEPQYPMVVQRPAELSEEDVAHLESSLLKTVQRVYALEKAFNSPFTESIPEVPELTELQAKISHLETNLARLVRRVHALEKDGRVAFPGPENPPPGTGIGYLEENLAKTIRRIVLLEKIATDAGLGSTPVVEGELLNADGSPVESDEAVPEGGEIDDIRSDVDAAVTAVSLSPKAVQALRKLMSASKSRDRVRLYAFLMDVCFIDYLIGLGVPVAGDFLSAFASKVYLSGVEASVMDLPDSSQKKIDANLGADTALGLVPVAS